MEHSALYIFTAVLLVCGFGAAGAVSGQIIATQAMWMGEKPKLAIMTGGLLGAIAGYLVSAVL